MTSDADLTWIEENAPYSRRFKDRYFSAHEGREETRAVFLAGNGLPGRWRDAPGDLLAPRDRFEGRQFSIAELGFGTGLNFFETLALWKKQAHKHDTLTYSSFELYPLCRDEIARVLVNWPELGELAAPVLNHWPLTCPLQLGPVRLELICGDARDTLPLWTGQVDAWYLDGFSPAKNPQLWGDRLMRQVFEHTKPGGTFSTYTAAGFVRRNLQDAGFKVQKNTRLWRQKRAVARRKNKR